MSEPTPDARVSPMLQQYFGVKRQHPDALLFFRMGDFFELFFEDAKVASKVLGIALTSRSKDQEVPMAGVPVRTVDAYLRKLIVAGHTVVVCDQVEDPKAAKGLVERAVTRVVTAGTLLEDALLESGRHNWLAAADVVAPNEIALAWLDLSTARFEGATVPAAELADELDRLAPAELLLPERFRDARPAELAPVRGVDAGGPALTFRPAHEFEDDVARRALQEHLRVADLAGFGIDPGDRFVGTASAILARSAASSPT